MIIAQPSWIWPLVRSDRPMGTALEHERLVLRRTAGRDAVHRRVVPFAILALLSCSVALAGCGPSGAEAKPAATDAPLAQPTELPKPTQVEPAAAKPSKPNEDYVFAFQGRSNPFALPTSGAGVPSTGKPARRASNVKVVALMRCGAGSMVVLQVDGDEHIVEQGARITPPAGADDLHVVEIRRSDIVVKQGGRQWIVSLTQPEIAPGRVNDDQQSGAR
ncbi:MAG: hypothetical protein IH988_01360 [Planctomycetes bacterium]|nr:hypothetical protein [Planctomycetota bacterium]